MRKVRVAPKGMGLNDFVAEAEGFFAAEGIEVEWDIKTFRGTQSRWTENKYLQRPQDKPYTEAKDDSLIQCACQWGTISNAAAYGIIPDYSRSVAEFVRIQKSREICGPHFVPGTRHVPSAAL